jgi:hypothetical protein
MMVLSMSRVLRLLLYPVAGAARVDGRRDGDAKPWRSKPRAAGKMESRISLMSPSRANGKICCLELPTRDVDASYSGVSGWRTRRREDGHLAVDDATGEVSGTWVTGRFRDSGGNVLGLYKDPDGEW